jgi:hypothetical protein
MVFLLLLLLLLMLSDMGIVAFVPSVGSLMPSLTFSFDLFFETGVVVNQFVRSGQSVRSIRSTVG